GVLVKHSSNLSVHGGGNEVIAHAKGSVLNENRCNVAATLIDLGFQNGAHGGQSRIGFEVLQVGDKHNDFEQKFEILPGLRGHLDSRRVAAPVFSLQTLQIGRASCREGEDVSSLSS